MAGQKERVKTVNRQDALTEIRNNWETMLRGITHTARQNVNGRQSYVCPICGHGSHGDGLTINPKGRPGALMCFGCGFSGDIIDLLQRVNNCDFNTALNAAAAELGITIDPYKSDAAADFADADRVQGAQRADKKKDRETATGTAKQPQRATGTATEGETADYTAYYAQCSERLRDPAALSYLQARGISAETAQRFRIGYDPQADPANAPGAMGGDYRPHPAPRLIIPCTRGYYVARATDPGNKYKAPNPKGSRAQLFNAGALYNPEPGVVFVTEGIFDALSFVEAGAQAVATNSKNNGQALTNLLQRGDAKARQFVICPDNDPDPKTNANTQATAQKLCDDLRALGNNCIVYNVAGQDHDANDALRRDKAGFAQRIAEAQAALQREALPGLLCYEDLVKEFQEADDSIITIKSFPEFSKTAKIKKHSTVALAADTGGGKSSLSLNFLNDLNSEYPCIYFNLEMDMITVLRRLVAIQSGLELDRIEGYKQDPKTAAAVNAYLKQIANRKPLQVIQGVYQLGQIEGIIKRSTADREEPTIVFIDHSLLVETEAKTAGRYERFTIVSEQLRKMALRYNVVLFVLLQQNRAGKDNDEERPKNSSLKESGSWENDATHIIFLWYDPQARRKKLIITKNRGGDSGEFALNYWSRTQTYTEAKEPPVIRSDTPAGRDFAPAKPTKREKAQERLRDAYMQAAIKTGGNVTLRAIAEAADVTTATAKGWVKEYGGCIVDGVPVDPAGIDTAVEYTGFVKLTPGDENPFIPSQERVQEVVEQYHTTGPRL